MHRPTFICDECGGEFESLAPPAETRPEDPYKMCDRCIEAMLDAHDVEPLDPETINRIVKQVTSNKGDRTK